MDAAWLVRAGEKVTSRDRLREFLLSGRGGAGATGSAFFAPDYERDVGDPYTIRGMDTAVARVARARSRRERVLVYGDYDADGITGAAILVSTLTDLGVSVLPYLPHRLDDGYGLHGAALERLAAEFDLLISVDCGVSNAAEIEQLAQAGKDTIIVDHHTLPEVLPPAVAVLHPILGEYQCPYLSGAGMAWKFAQALLRSLGQRAGLSTEYEKWLLDLCCIGTVADMVPLVGENRVIVQFGLEVLRRSARPAVQLLRGLDDSELTTEFIGYRIAPLLNAAGRMEHPQPALDFLLARETNRAQELLGVLQAYNTSRRTLSRRIQREAEKDVGQDLPIVFAYNETWPAGVVGLVAGRLSDKFSRLAVVVGGGGQHAVGSVRAPAGINVMEYLAAGREHMLKLGGHASAAGFSVEHAKVSSVREALLNYPGAGELPVAIGPAADALIDAALLDWETWEMLQQFQPYGEGNKRPALVVQDVPVASWRPVGKEGDHAKIDFIIGGAMVGGIAFGLGQGEAMQAIMPGSTVDVLFHLDCNEWRGRRSLQLLVQAIAPAGRVKLVSSE